MLEGGRDPPFAQEALAETFVVGQLRRQHLERDAAS
jgi:hypothetical protein